MSKEELKNQGGGETQSINMHVFLWFFFLFSALIFTLQGTYVVYYLAGEQLVRLFIKVILKLSFTFLDEVNSL